MKRLNPELVDFLKHNNAYEVFETNFKNKECNGTMVCGGNDHDIETTTILDAFDWDDTPQGIKFWSDLNKEYGSI